MKITIQSSDPNADALLYETASWLRARGFDVQMPPVPSGQHLPQMSKALRETMTSANESIAFERTSP